MKALKEIEAAVYEITGCMSALAEKMEIAREQAHRMVDAIGRFHGLVSGLVDNPRIADEAAPAVRRGRKGGRKARAVSNDTAPAANGGAPLVRKTKKGAAFGKADVAELLGDGMPKTRDQMAEALVESSAKMLVDRLRVRLRQIPMVAGEVEP